MDVIPYKGGVIAKGGLYSGVSMKAYHGPLTAGRSISRSRLWTLFNEDPAHYWRTSPYNPEAEDDSGSDAMKFGRAAHHLLLGESNFAEHFVLRPDVFDSWRTKEAKAWRATHELAGKDVLIPSDLETIRGMAFGLHANPLVRAGLLDGLVEHTMVAQDPETGIWVKIRPDAIPTESGDFADLKSTAEISDDGIETALGRDGLVLQGALTRMVCKWLGMPFNSFTLVFVEKGSPFCVQTRSLTGEDLELGEHAAHAGLKLFAKCLERSVWPGPGGEGADAQYITLKPFHRKQMERQIEIINNGL